MKEKKNVKKLLNYRLNRFFFVLFKFKLEDVNKVTEPPSTPSFIRRTALQGNPTPRPSSAPVDTTETTNVTLPLRRPKSIEEKGNSYKILN